MAVDDLHVNALLPLGENIADLGGVTIAYAGHQRSLGGRARTGVRRIPQTWRLRQ